ncbi:MAG: hypothetical protein NTW35_01870 [Candidatus Nomurabacteria bacterium]|nr:hypothetical protein [Candidatus Nomurabacteria bacterium]
MISKQAWLVHCTYLNAFGRHCSLATVIPADSDEEAAYAFKKDFLLASPKFHILEMAKPCQITGVQMMGEALDPEQFCVSNIVG